MFKRIVITLFTCISIAALVWANCHETSNCENLEVDLVSRNYWDEPNYNRVNYYVNEDYHDEMPTLTSDVNNAAAVWTELEFDGRRIEFTLRNAGTTSAYADTRDYKNVIAYGALDWNDQKKTAAVVDSWVNSVSGRIKEQDMMFNYYAPLQLHPDWEYGDVCIRNTAVHEFGHFIRLKDVYRNQCIDYRHYTMSNEHMWNHDAESLTCEDKWAAHQVYPED